MYQFTITIASGGKDVNEAWNGAVNALAMDAGDYPEDLRMYIWMKMMRSVKTLTNETVSRRARG